jgi:hypothetical protein
MGSPWKVIRYSEPVHPLEIEKVRQCPMFQSVMSAVKIRRAIKKRRICG